MRIRKISQSAAIPGKIVNSPSDSTTETYSCDYINDVSVVVSPTEPTGGNRKKIWMQHGKPNLFNPSTAQSFLGYFDKTKTSITSSGQSKITYMSITGGKTYTVSKKAGTRFNVGTTSATPQVGTSIIDNANNVTEANVQINATKVTIETSSNAQYLIIWYYAGTDTVSDTEMLNSIRVVEGTEVYVDDKEYILNENNIYEKFEPQNEVYSTEEVKIGTWIDGKPLYRKVVVYTPSEIIGGVGKVTDIYIQHGISNFKQLCGQKCITSDGYILPTLGSKSGTTLDYGTCMRAVTAETIDLRLVNDSFGIRTWYITLEYTKTTD